jgi:hypothetical protein
MDPSYSNEHKKLTGRENLTTFTCWLGPGGSTDKENQVKLYKKDTVLGVTSLKQKGFVS